MTGLLCVECKNIREDVRSLASLYMEGQGSICSICCNKLLNEDDSYYNSNTIGGYLHNPPSPAIEPSFIPFSVIITSNNDSDIVELQNSLSCLDNNFSNFKTEQEKKNEKLESEINQNAEDINKTKEDVNNLKENTQLPVILKGIDEEEKKSLEKLTIPFLKKEHYLELTEKQKKKIREAKSIPQFQIITDNIKKDHAKIKELAENNIYGWTTKHKLGWLTFLILASVATKKIRKIIKKKSKPTNNLKEEIQEKFSLWRLNMGLSVVGYGVAFVLLKGIIDKWLRPNIYRWLESDESVTVAAVTSMLGLLFLADGIITSELKTPLQRLSIKIENADISEKEKKSLLSKTQQSNETFKETLKRFGLLSIAGIAIKLLGDAFDKNPLSLLCYVVPLAFGGWRIWEVSRVIKKNKWKK